MKPFLSELADKINRQYPDQLENLTLVFPNRRAGLFFRKYLASTLQNPVWSPEIITMEDFVLRFTDYKPVDKLPLLFQLHKIYAKHSKMEEGFDRFYYWGDMLLKDFDDVDKYMVNASRIFSVVRDQKEIDQVYDYLNENQLKTIATFWKELFKDNSKEKDNFKKIWEVLFPVYTEFTSWLKKNNQGYAGLIYRDVAERVKDNQLEVPEDPILFAGFNALTSSEETIITWCLRDGKADIYWDIDEYYVSQKHQEAGVFFRQYLEMPVFSETFPNPMPSNLKANRARDVQITGVSMRVGQAKILGQDLKEISDKSEFEKTVVVLPQENMLFPVLSSMPEHIDKINVTMGFPLRNTSWYSLIEHLLEMQIHKKQSKTGSLFPHRQVLAILKHPLIKFRDASEVRKLVNKIEKRNWIFVSSKELDLGSPVFKSIFSDIKDGDELFDYLLDVILILNSNTDDGTNSQSDPLDRSFAFQFYTQLNRLKDISIQQKVNLPFKAFLRLFRQMIQALKMPFTGEPLQGLQIMGVLETRNLDFENVYILSMNEGLFPSEGGKLSFIPYNIRKVFKLPTMEHQDAIYAYLFYRLIQKAKKIRFYYNSDSGNSSDGEMSRFLKQLKHEGNFDLQYKVLNNTVYAQTENEISIYKNRKVEETLSKYLVGQTNDLKRLTPSALNTYLDCRLRFYFRYLAGLKETEKVDDEIDPRVFGNILHVTMEELYKNFIHHHNRIDIRISDFDFLKKNLDKSIEKAFCEQFDVQENQTFQFEGRNILIRSFIKKYASQILKLDQAYAPFEIIGLEAGQNEGIALDLPVMIKNQQKLVGFKGVIDRIDRKQGKVRVIDYKTGKDMNIIQSVSSLFERENGNRNKAAMQTIFYSHLYSENLGNPQEKIQPGIMNSKELFRDDYSFGFNFKNQDPIDDVQFLIPEFRAHLIALVEEIFNPDTEFDQTEDRKKCEYCAYKTICHR